jgi:hypothetical protein
VRTSTKIEPVFNGKTSTAVIFKLRKSLAAFRICGEMCWLKNPATLNSPPLRNSRLCIITSTPSSSRPYALRKGERKITRHSSLVSLLFRLASFALPLSPCPFRLSPIAPAPSRETHRPAASPTHLQERQEQCCGRRHISRSLPRRLPDRSRLRPRRCFAHQSSCP